jgi:tetratricopeptide (TPR) repeat protein
MLICFLNASLCVLLTLSKPAMLDDCAFAESVENQPIVSSAHLNDVFDIANEEYKAGNFRDALRLYEGLLSSTGVETADIYYNIGNTHFKLNNQGKAIVSYRRALMLAPRDQDIRANLNHVREMNVDKIAQAQSTELFRELFFFHYSLSKKESEAVFLCLYLTLTIIAIIFLVRKSKTVQWLMIAAFMLTFVFGTSTITKWYGSTHSNGAVVVANEAEVRTGPGQKYMVSFDLHDGAELKVRKRANDWCQIELPDGRRGWVNVSHIEIV